MNAKPNVLLVTCDQLRPFELGCYGHPVIKTPNIDRLAVDGVRFQTAVTTNPVCVPARSSLMTGQYSRTCTGSLENVYADDGPVRERVRLCDLTIAEAFRDSGYDTALIGKWHIHPHPLTVGFDSAMFPLVPHRYSGQTYFSDYGAGYRVDEFTSEYELEAVRSYVQNRSTRSGQPFFLNYNISLPHQPIWEGIPERYRSMYHRDEVILRDNVVVDGKLSYSEYWNKVYLYADFFWEWLAARRAGRNDFDDTPWTLPDIDGCEFDLKSLYALYYGAVGCVDDLIGGLLDILANQGMIEDTIVAFVSDHGDNLGSHDLYNKGRLIEESIRIPLVFHAPGRIDPRVAESHVASIIDVYPTLLDIAGVAVPESVQGRSLSRVVQGDVESITPNRAFMETDRSAIGIRTPRWTFGMQLDQERREVENESLCLYDNVSDPFQVRNVAGLDDWRDIEHELRKEVLSFDRTTPWLEILA
jgi:arylsulfatase A-like enzyme